MSENSYGNILTFLDQISTGLKENTLTDRQALRVGEFMMEYQEAEGFPSDDMMMKYIIMGWWVYSHMDKNELAVPGVDSTD